MMPLFSRLNNRRDIVFVDQRGTGKSAPLECADTRREPLSDQSDPERQVEADAALPRPARELADRRRCRRPALLHDDDRDAGPRRGARELGAERIDLIGASYGTRAALEYQRQFPNAVRRSVLDGVAPPDMVLPASFSTDDQAAFEAALAACERETACAIAYPRLRADWQALLAGLPKAVVVPDPLTGAPTPLRLTRDVLLGAVRGALYAPALAAALPAAIDAAAHGRYEALVGIASLVPTSRRARRRSWRWACTSRSSAPKTCRACARATTTRRRFR